jgi:hypothetical protein
MALEPDASRRAPDSARTFPEIEICPPEGTIPCDTAGKAGFANAINGMDATEISAVEAISTVT